MAETRAADFRRLLAEIPRSAQIVDGDTLNANSEASFVSDAPRATTFRF